MGSAPVLGFNTGGRVLFPRKVMFSTMMRATHVEVHRTLSTDCYFPFFTTRRGADPIFVLLHYLPLLIY